MFYFSPIDPVAFALDPFTFPWIGVVHLQIRWYGLMYLVGFAAAWGLGRYRARRTEGGLTPALLDDLIFFMVLGVILGGRIGFVLFYHTATLLEDPLYLFRIWEGGMSFHGGFIGVLLALWLFGRKHGLPFFYLGDFIAPLAPIGLLAGRIGNFINGELWGRVTDVSWGVKLPCDLFPAHCAGLPLDSLWSPPVHASQLYEAALEGALLFLILWLFSARPRPTMAVSGLFLLCYGLFRSIVELVREPDAHLGFLAFDWLTMGQLLSLPMLLAGALLLGLAYRNRG